jgi:nitrate reductase NapAB chaperone NapD
MAETIIGGYARVDSGRREGAVRRLSQLRGVSTFDLDEPGKLGVLIEASSIDEAHAILTEDVSATPGVLACWPVFLHEEPDANTDCRRESDGSGTA